SEGGDVFDCVDIYKQPSLYHPLLKNEKHKISKLLEKLNKEYYNSELEFDFPENKTEDCPQGTVPIVRSDQSSDDVLRLMRKMKYRLRNSSNTNATFNDSQEIHEYVTMSTDFGEYYGAKATFNVWKPYVAYSDEFSLAQMWLNSGPRSQDDFNSIEVGWQVPVSYFTFRRDNYQSTGCYNLDCEGFILIGNMKEYAPGAKLSHWSTYKSIQSSIEMAIKKDQRTGDWHLFIDNHLVGYWPGRLFTRLDGFSDRVSWGGEIVNRRRGGHHTRTQMGSGYPAQKGYSKAAYIRDIQVMHQPPPHDNWVDPPQLQARVTNPTCYSLDDSNVFPFPGVGFFYGGKGYSETCL
uniref:Neprosin PEP catalytic domain-containing protein n=1 Tax=Kalanchoe fedtschenkoi TaxID=63787 RepID=A0A7N0T148_KALFE